VLGLAPVRFVAATLLGSLIWNAPLLTLGYVLRESGADAASVGLWLVAGLAALEIVALCAWRFRRGRQDRSRRSALAAEKY
jgi:membrane protein DedA with SNARE-associated domain